MTVRNPARLSRERRRSPEPGRGANAGDGENPKTTAVEGK